MIDSADRVLLLENFDPAKPEDRYWVTIGGGVDDGEEAAQAAVRELREETGIAAAVDELTGPVWHRSTEFSFDGTRYQQEEDYFLLRVGEVEVTFDYLEPDERRLRPGTAGGAGTTWLPQLIRFILQSFLSFCAA